MNYITIIVKIVHIDYTLYFNKNITDIFWIEFYGKLSDNSTKVKITVWGNYLKTVLTHYAINDYVLVEGYLTGSDDSDIEIILKKIYPIFLD